MWQRRQEWPLSLPGSDSLSLEHLGRALGLGFHLKCNAMEGKTCILLSRYKRAFYCRLPALSPQGMSCLFALPSPGNLNNFSELMVLGRVSSSGHQPNPGQPCSQKQVVKSQFFIFSLHTTTGSWNQTALVNRTDFNSTGALSAWAARPLCLGQWMLHENLPDWSPVSFQPQCSPQLLPKHSGLC